MALDKEKKPTKLHKKLAVLADFVQDYKKWYKHNQGTINTLDEGSNPTLPPPPPSFDDEDGE